MPRISCSKGHIYDSAIYGDNCPFCPSQGSGTAVNNNNFDGSRTVGNFGGGTEVNQEAGGRTQVNGGTVGGGNPTIPMGEGNYGGVSGGTVIRPAGGGTGTSSGKRIMGLLVTYSITKPTGQVFHIYEGRNYVGRDANVDISIPNDFQVSSKHLSILYRLADGKFKFKDEQSSNGTFVNETLTDEGELNNFDVIRVGSTKLIFIAIPQIP
ncbi:MAG: FHA domain-containing protein [Prevotellaceae bacterium]|jgi:hypothetical protein|nr:FHA domain-containing protein [Prevotellaceae bacterium]